MQTWEDDCFLYYADLLDPMSCAWKLYVRMPLHGQKTSVWQKFPSDFLPFSIPPPFWERATMLELFHWEAATSVVWLLVLPSIFPELSNRRQNICALAVSPHWLKSRQQRYVHEFHDDTVLGMIALSRLVWWRMSLAMAEGRTRW